MSGTPELVADELQCWADAGVGGINVMYMTTPAGDAAGHQQDVAGLPEAE